MYVYSYKYSARTATTDGSLADMSGDLQLGQVSPIKESFRVFLGVRDWLRPGLHVVTAIHTSHEWITSHGHPPTFNWAINMYRMSLNRRMFATSGANTSVTHTKRNTKFVYLYANSPHFDQLEGKKHQIFTTQVPTPLYILLIHR